MKLQDISQPVIFFDDVCNLCNSSVQFIIRHDKKKQFLFAPLQSELGQEAIKQFPGKAPDSVVLFYKRKFFVKSDATLNIAKLLDGGWKLCYAGIILPRFIRNGIYDFVSRNRYKWFGRKEACMIPTAELRARFIA